MSKAASLTRVLLAYVVAIAVGSRMALPGARHRPAWLDGLIADVIATLVIFVFSRGHHNSSFYDAYWSVLPPLLASTGGARARRKRRRCGPAALLVIVLWAVRLTVQLGLRVPRAAPRGLALPAAA